MSVVAKVLDKVLIRISVQGCNAKSGVKQDYDMSRFLLVIDWNREKYSRGW